MARRQATASARGVARERFGFDELHSGQKRAIEALVAGRDTLVVMPTGAGKSAIYQIAGILVDGPTVVVSPLLALQRDQVEALEERDAGGAAQVSSAVKAGERREAFEDFEEDELEFLFLAPEQFAADETLDRVAAAQPSLFVVDEAHCISEWGHDFRPDYLRLGDVLEAVGRPPVLALTATASPRVREEILARLGMREPEVVVEGFDRPNIRLDVRRFEDERAKTDALLDEVEAADKPGIVYAATRRRAEEIADALTERGLRAVAYHAGLKARDRDELQDAFMRDEVDVIVATIAFGMGIDKANVRFVFHNDVSDSVDSYYQEIGRAGRDGDPARAVLFYRPQDLGLRRFFAATGQVDADELVRVAEAVRRRGQPVRARDLREEIRLSETKIETALARLESAGVVETLPTGEVAPGDRELDLEAAAEEGAREQERRLEFDRSRIEMMRGYAEVRDCRRGYLLNYFGEEAEERCGNCDNCKAGVVQEEGREPFPLNSRVAHAEWGEGLVQRYEGDKVVVLFDEVGYKTLDVGLVEERRLLAAAGDGAES